MIEVVAGHLRQSRASYGNALTVAIEERYGQLGIHHATTRAAVVGAYVKVYARMQDGRVTFYKDGYTDLRGAFDYATLSTDELDRVDRFSILSLTEEHGAVIRECGPPPR